MTAENEFKKTVRLKNNLLPSKYEICIERMIFFTEVYQNNPKDTQIVRKAKAAAHTLQNMTIFIRDDELLVGNETSKNLGEKVNLDLQGFTNNLDQKSTYEKLAKRSPQLFYIQDNDIHTMNKFTANPPDAFMKQFNSSGSARILQPLFISAVFLRLAGWIRYSNLIMHEI
ncbi:MAG: hypothetical protein C0403_06020 [Desulfobacterium sp.]|nr:hypothetical protein [Desulfobacterium sp.]